MTLLKFPQFSSLHNHVNQQKFTYVFDPVRKREIRLTPEEWIRQQLLQFLITTLYYPKGLIKIEQGLRYEKKVKRIDLLVYSPLTHKPLLLFECKQHGKQITKLDMGQLMTYNYVIRAPFVGIMNGIEWYLLQKKKEGWKMLPGIPYFKDIVNVLFIDEKDQ